MIVRKSIKNSGFILIAILLLAMLLHVMGLQLSALKVDAATEQTNTLTQLTTAEQAKVDEQLLKDWGNPTKMTELTDGFTISTLSNGGWFYLTKDITASCNGMLSKDTHILLNGYTISGTFTVTTRAVLNLYDKIPNQSGMEYAYNPTPIKYFGYDSSTKSYSTHSTNKLNGTNVTAMPNFEENTYIKAAGSVMTRKVQILLSETSIVNLYGINIVGVYLGETNTSYILKIASSTLNIYQCNILGNQTHNAVYNTQSKSCTLIGSIIYGNQAFSMYYPANSKVQYCDIWLWNTSKNTKLYKSNIGEVCWIVNNNIIVQFLKDTDFGHTKQIVDITNCYFYQNYSNIEGTIELMNDCNITYTGHSPNLSFIVHGKDSRVVVNANTLILGANAVVNTVVVSGTGQIENGAIVDRVLHDGVNGRLIDNRQTSISDVGSANGSTSKVTINSSARLGTLDIRAGDYGNSGVLPPPDYNENDGVGGDQVIVPPSDGGNNGGTDSGNNNNGSTGGNGSNNGGTDSGNNNGGSTGGNGSNNGDIDSGNNNNGSTGGNGSNNGNTAGGVDGAVTPSIERNQTAKIVTIVSLSLGGVLLLIIVIVLLLWYKKHKRYKKIREKFKEKLTLSSQQRAANKQIPKKDK